MAGTKTIYDYDNYRNYLKDLYLESKAKDRKFSFQYFAKLFGFSSTSFFKHVIDGHKNLSEDSAGKIAAALKLNKEETAYLLNLVRLNQAKSSEERGHFSQEILKSRAYKKFHPLSASQLDYFTHWYFIVIREMVNLHNFKEDPQWIASQVVPAITPRQAQDAIEQLLKLGLLARDEKGRLTQTTTLLATADEVSSGLLAQYHREFMRRASESIDLISRENRDISSVTFRVSLQTAQRIKEKIQKFRKELAEEASRDSHSESIYQLNLQLFPVTQVPKVKTGGGKE